MPSSTKSGTTTPSRSKRSTTNLANLRLAPLSARFTEDTPDTASTDGASDAFGRLTASHRSAPTSPRILSRSSSRRGFAGGLSRRSSLYEGESEDLRITRGGIGEETTPNIGPRLEIASTHRVPKAKSEAALSVPSHQHRRLAGPGVQLKRKHYDAYGLRSGGTTPRVTVDEDDWLTHTARAASGILQQAKGQSFIASRNSATTLGIHTQDLTSDEDGDEDEGYEELAALSARTTMSRSGFTADDELSPVSTRASRWGSRYGSRRGSRRGSTVGFSGSRTPLASTQADNRTGYFHASLPVAPDFVDEEEDSDAAQSSTFTSLGGLVDRVMGTHFFGSGDGDSTGGESEGDGEGETEEVRERRVKAESQRREGEKERLREGQRRRFAQGTEEGGGWEDARWLFGRAREAWG